MLAGTVVFAASCKKEGCMDETATNYDSKAKKDDGSCQYAVVETPAPVVKTVGQKTITDDGTGTGTVTWSNDTTYFLSGRVFVNAGQTLTIEAGTVIKGKLGEGENSSALIVAKGGKINAVGTKDMPIIFTTELDKTERDTAGVLVQSTELTEANVGQWGGLIILGAAKLNSTPGFVTAFWDENSQDEEDIKNQTKATLRCYVLGNNEAGESVNKPFL